MNEPEQTPISEAVAAFVARTRREHDVTLDEIARRARVYGASWRASTVGNIERGRASLKLDTLIYLALAMSSVTGQDLAIADLLGDARALSLDKGRIALKREWFDRVLGTPLGLAPSDIPGIADPDKPEEWSDDRELHRSMERIATDEEFRSQVEEGAVQAQYEASLEPPELEEHAERLSTLAEQRAAKKLNIPVEQLRRTAIDLWGCPLEVESRWRAGEGSTPQGRGRVTRILIDEVHQEMERTSSPRERRAARRLRTTISRLQDAATRLWRHSLDDEVSHELAKRGSGADPELEGRIERTLVNELGRALMD